jgi:hypothetical protein
VEWRAHWVCVTEVNCVLIRSTRHKTTAGGLVFACRATSAFLGICPHPEKITQNPRTLALTAGNIWQANNFKKSALRSF